MPFDIDARLAEWRKRLLDTTKRNRLIKFVTGRIGGMNLIHPGPGVVWSRLVREGESFTFGWKREILGLTRDIPDPDTLATDIDPATGKSGTGEFDQELTKLCVRSPHLRPEHLLTDFSDRFLAARLTRLFRTAKEAATDHGVTTLFAAFGFLRWFETPDSDEELLSPLLLVPVRLDRETVESPFTLSAEEDEVLANHCLAELLQSQFRIRLPTAAEHPLDTENPDCLPNYLRAVAEVVKHVPRWGVVEATALGVFNFQKLAMWEDLGRNAERVKAHPLCRAVAGDTAVSLAPMGELPVAADLDRLVPPAEVVHILDADSSQHEGIEAARRGAHLVIDGPPGTGKSQTIANIIAESLAAGKTVLFVSEKTAALDVVKRRLDRCGLGDFCLELHSHKANKKQVVTELGRCLDLKPSGVPDMAARLGELAEARAKLNEFVAELHAVRPPLGWSAFRVHGELARLISTAPRSRLSIPDVLAKDAEFVRKGTGILAALSDCRSVIEEPGGHPWRGCKVTTYSHGVADEAKFNLTRLATALGPVVDAATELTNLGVCPAPPTPRNWLASETDAERILAAPVFPAAWFTTDPKTATEAVIALDSASRTARELIGKLPEFDSVAVRGATLDSLDGLVPARDRVVTPLPARERVGALTRIATALRALAAQAATIDKHGREVAAPLRLTLTPPFAALPTIAAAGSLLASKPPVPPAWWEPARRSELLAATTRAEADEKVLSELRTRLLSTKLSPVALAPASSALAIEAATASASAWRWLPWSRWAKVRKQVEAWYPGGPPDKAALRADVNAVAAYHRLADAIQHTTTMYAGQLLLDASGKPDWTATRVALANIDETMKWKPAGELRALVADGASPEAENRRRAAETLLRETVAFEKQWVALLRESAYGEAAALLTRPAHEVVAALEAEATAVEQEAAALGRLVALLAAGKDIPAANLREQASRLRELIAARARIAASAKTLNDTRSPEALEAADHTADATLAQALLAFLAVWAKPVAPAIGGLLSDPAARVKLQPALDRSKAVRIDFDKAWERVTAELFDPDVVVSTKLVLHDTPLAELAAWATARAADTDRLAEWSRFLQVEKDAAAFGIAPILDEVKAAEYPAVAAADAFRVRFYRLWLDALQQLVPALAAFNTENHERLIARFAELDRLSIRTTPERVRTQLLVNRCHPQDDPPDSSELGILRREANKKRRHLPLRNLFQRIPTILPRIKPCLMMSPLAVSTYLDTPELSFDLVIFDEASQVRPHDAVCALYRGRQLVVGGDPKQLPPTDFFTRTGDEIEDWEADPSEGLESLLDLCLAKAITRKPLRWHYRSRREGLIAFSNRYFYGGRLVTFPSADEATGPAVRFLRVAEGRFKDGVNPIEAKRVAAMIMEHVEANPTRSLGVIAFSQRQQDRILDELEVLRRLSPDTEPFFDDGREDPFFVKNLENVQGDERDVIFLSVGYGPDDTGKVAMRFGPLNRAGGERRLNVAITRARWALTVVSSLTAADIDLSRTSAEGAKLLKAYLDYAERGPVALAEAITAASENGAESPFEQEVGDELMRRGLAVHRQVGCGGYRIDLAIADPQQGGKYLLGVECDGATYHSAATARDRDRLRQAVLEGLGWRLVRVWSSDWVRDREKQVRRILAALDAAKAGQPRVEPQPESVPLVKVRPTRAKPPTFDAIEDAKEPAITDAIVACLTEFGSMPVEDLVVAVSKRLGFGRTGAKIRERIATVLNGLVTAGRVVLMGDDARVTLVRNT